MADTNGKSSPADELAELEGTPTVALSGRPATDVLGARLDWTKPDDARKQQRAAEATRRQRVEVDVKRVERGLEPKYATK